jgi:hypothetical protein
MNYCVIPEGEGQIGKRKRKEKVKWRQTKMIMSSQERFIEDHQNVHVIFFFFFTTMLIFFLSSKYIRIDPIDHFLHLIIILFLLSTSFFLFFPSLHAIFAVVLRSVKSLRNLECIYTRTSVLYKKRRIAV